ncbi:serine dehydratase beta chain, partial [Tamlana crocina]|uniref:serine dehydratase beta chain n=1 Tax=Tamlana crocina TaxID=393006 RepID=UPI0031598848
MNNIKTFNRLNLNGERSIDFILENDIVFNKKFLPFHPNGMKFTALLSSGKTTSSTFYSIGGGFVVKEERKNAKKQLKKFKEFPFPIVKGTDLSAFCKQENK